MTDAALPPRPAIDRPFVLFEDGRAGGSALLFEAPREAWYRTGPVEGGQREFLVQDPDGYLVRLAEDLGHRQPA